MNSASRHLAGRLDELAVAPSTGDMALDGDVVRRVGEDHPNLVAGQQPVQHLWDGRITDDEPVVAQPPDVAQTGDRLGLRRRDIVIAALGVADPEADRPRSPAGRSR